MTEGIRRNNRRSVRNRAVFICNNPETARPQLDTNTAVSAAPAKRRKSADVYFQDRRRDLMKKQNYKILS
ncbi:hypothetical protein B4100_0818 [Heyndrickxia coagulans]|nr:hypothetical protein B4100_0818 [Heyndrickxia coagulans]